MADGASAIIGIVAFGLHAVHKVYEVVDSFRDAPADILALKHDAKQIGSLLLQLQQSGVLDSGVAPPSVDLAMLMKIFEDALSQVELFIDKVAEDRRDGKRRVRKLQWFLKAGRCERLAGNLASLKTSIIAIIAASTSQSVDAVQALVIRIVEAQKRSCSSMDAFKRDHDSWVAQQVSELASLREAVEERMAILAYNQDRMYCMLSSISSSNVDRQSSNPRASPAVPMPVPDIPVSDDCEGSNGGRPLRQTSQSISVAPRMSRPLTMKDLKEPLQCETPCECCCHDTRLTHATPYWGSSWFGNLYLPRCFFHRSFASCNVRTCRRTQKKCQIAKIKWFFPSWFIAVDMKIRLQAFPVHFCLQTPRRVPETSPIFGCIQRMDIDGVRGLLGSAEASVNDVDEDGWGVLHHAAYRIYDYSYEQVSRMLQLLVGEGAHIEWEEYEFHRTPLQLLQEWESWQQQESGMSFVRAVQMYIAGPVFHEDLLDTWEDWMEKSLFSEVHRAVLTHRIRNMSLKDMLSSAVADINVPCRMGLTPLEWGIWMRVPNVVETLLECGADVHKGYPLHQAASWGDVEALRLLVHAGADINLPDNDEGTPLHNAAYYGQARIVEELIRIGGDNLELDILDRDGYTALDIARTRREDFVAMGLSTNGDDKIILILSELQTSSGGRSSMPKRFPEMNTYIKTAEDLCIPGSFPTE